MSSRSQNPALLLRFTFEKRSVLAVVTARPRPMAAWAVDVAGRYTRAALMVSSVADPGHAPPEPKMAWTGEAPRPPRREAGLHDR